MERLNRGRNTGSSKFIIKSKAVINHMRSQNTENNSSNYDYEVDIFLTQMAQKSIKFKQALSENNITSQEQFCNNYLFKSICVKIMIKTVIDRMINDRRLGRNLKGMNRANMIEIENAGWSAILREIDLYKNNKQYKKNREVLQQSLVNRKTQILRQLNKLGEKKL